MLCSASWIFFRVQSVPDAPFHRITWRRVLEIVAHGCPNIEVVVSSRLGDHKLWIDVLEQRAYDVLVEPYEWEEVRRIVEAAAADKSYIAPCRPPER